MAWFHAHQPIGSSHGPAVFGFLLPFIFPLLCHEHHHSSCELSHTIEPLFFFNAVHLLCTADLLTTSPSQLMVLTSQQDPLVWSPLEHVTEPHPTTAPMQPLLCIAIKSSFLLPRLNLEPHPTTTPASCLSSHHHMMSPTTSYCVAILTPASHAATTPTCSQLVRDRLPPPSWL